MLGNTVQRGPRMELEQPRAGKHWTKKSSWEDTAAEVRADSEVTSEAGGSSYVLTERKKPYTVV